MFLGAASVLALPQETSNGCVFTEPPMHLKKHPLVAGNFTERIILWINRHGISTLLCLPHHYTCLSPLNNSRAKQSRMHLCNTFCAANLTITGTGILLLHRGFLFLSFPTDKKHGVQSWKGRRVIYAIICLWSAHNWF